MEDTILALFLGVGLSAAAGFRVFLPLLVMSAASMSGHMTLSPEFEWIGTYPALSAFAVASFLEISAYYVPWLDNLLDTVAIPAATVAGTVVMASAVTEMSPILKWSLAVIVGGGVAGTVQGLTTVTRLGSTATTGGLANPVVSTVEAGSSLIMSILAIAIPVVAAVLVLGLLFYGGRALYRRHNRRTQLKTEPSVETQNPFGP